jgi:hypothetical protein
MMKIHCRNAPQVPKHAGQRSQVAGVDLEQPHAAPIIGTKRIISIRQLPR